MTNGNRRNILTRIRLPLLAALALLAAALAVLAPGVSPTAPASAHIVTETETHSHAVYVDLDSYVTRVTLCRSELDAIKDAGHLTLADSRVLREGTNARNQRFQTSYEHVDPGELQVRSRRPPPV